MTKEVWGFKEDVITFLDDELIGGHEQFLKWAMGNHGYKDFRLNIRQSNHPKITICTASVKHFLLAFSQFP